MSCKSVYDLGFRFAHESVSQYPAITFSFDTAYLESILENSKQGAGRISNSDYFKEIPLFDHTFRENESKAGVETFGFGDCVTVVRNRPKVVFEIILSMKRLFDASAMLHIITHAFEHITDSEEGGASLKQSIRLQTLFPYRPGIGGAVMGYVNAWIRENKVESVPRIEGAMKCAFRNVTDFPYEEDCRARLGGNRFFLGCFGDACDVAIYPGDESEITSYFDCHNVDHPFQQLTLLSGLAMICRLAKEDQKATQN